jgi:hypothetical protein
MTEKSGLQPKAAAPKPVISLSQPGLLQRTCECGAAPGLMGKCEDCASKRLSGGRSNPPALPQVPPPDQPTVQRQQATPRGHSFANLALEPKERFGIQAKLAIGRSGDKYEQEADRVADQVMRMPEGKASPHNIIRQQIITQSLTLESEGALQRDAVEMPREEEQEPDIQTKETSRQMPKVSLDLETELKASQRQGHLLPDGTRAFMESRFGQDFSQVRIHADSKSAQMNQILKAQAFTYQQHVFFGVGRYHPESSAGKHLLAHELTHVVQQSGSKIPSAQNWQNERSPSNSSQQIFIQNQPQEPFVQKQGDEQNKQELYSFTVTPTKVMSKDEFITFVYMQLYGIPNPNPTGEWSGVTAITADQVNKPQIVSIVVSLHHKRTDLSNPIYNIGRDEKGKRIGSVQRTKDLKKASFTQQQQITVETNKRFWEKTGDKTKRQLNSSPEDKALRDLWNNVQDEVLLEKAKLDSLPPEIKDVLGGDKNFQPKDYKQLIGISEKLKKLDSKDLALHRLHAMTGNLDELEEAIETNVDTEGEFSEEPAELRRLFQVLQAKVDDPKFADTGESWVKFAKFLDQNKEKIDGILHSDKNGKLTQAKIEKIIAEYNKFIAAEPVDTERPEKLETLDDFDKQFKYDPGWQKLSKEDRKLLLEYSKLNSDQITDGQVNFSRVTTEMKMSMALKLADTTLLGEVGEAAKAAFTDPAFLITLILIVGIYVGLWLTPEPSGVTKVAAGVLTVALLAQFAWEDIYGFAKAWFQFTEDCAVGKSTDQLKKAGDKFLKAIGPIGFDIALAIVMWGVGKAVGPKIAKIGANRGVVKAEAAVKSAEARPGSGVTPKATPESVKLAEGTKAKGTPPTEVLDGFSEKLKAEGSKQGLKDFRSKLGDAKALEVLEGKQQKGLDIEHFLNEYGMSPEAKAAVKADLLEARAGLLRAKLLQLEAHADPALKKTVRAEAERLKKLDNIKDPKAQEALRADILRNLIGEIGEAIARADLKTEYASKGKGYKVLSNIEAVKEVPGYKTISEYKAARMKAGEVGDKIKTAHLREAQGKLWESLGEVDGFVVKEAPSGRLQPIEVEQVKTGVGDKASDTKAQNTKFMNALRDIVAGRKDVKLFERTDKAKLGSERTGDFDLSDLTSVQEKTRGLPGKEGFDRQLPDSREVFEALAKLILGEGLPSLSKPLPLSPVSTHKDDQKK